MLAEHTENIVSGVVTGFWVTERGLVIKLKVGVAEHLLLDIHSSRPDFLAQLEVVRFALATNEDHQVRAANGFETLPHKQLWAILREALPVGWHEASRRGAPVRCRALAVGLGSGNGSPFDLSAEGF